MERINLKEKEVFKKEGRGMANLVDEPYLLINQVCLEAGQNVPEHQANSNVTLQVISGEGTFFIGKEQVKAGPGNLLRVPLNSPMSIQNESPERLVFLVIKTPHPDAVKKDSPEDKTREGRFVNLIKFPAVKPGKEKEFRDWFGHSSELFAKHQGFISRTLLKSTEGTGRYAAVVEHESKETFMAMHLSDERKMLFKKIETLIDGMPKPDFYEVVATRRK
ncbi:MAG: antibiotic biosynthesis monooxygenase [Deltaproteobacteria bacterium]|nr:antibiotic biosynthesis monooxygenase [Deltaproteobacteria bacterium]